MDSMENWTLNQIFACCLISAALSGFATLLMSEKPLTIRNIMAYLLWFAAGGTATSMIGFEYLGGKEKPWRVIGSAIAVGMGIVKLSDIAPVIMKGLGAAIMKALRSVVGKDQSDV